MATRPEAENPKGKNITINVTDDLRERVDKLRKAHFSGLPINLFTGYLVEVGLEKEELRFEEEAIRNKAILERAANIETEEASPESGKKKQEGYSSVNELLDDILGENVHNLPFYARTAQAIAILNAKAEAQERDAKKPLSTDDPEPPYTSSGIDKSLVKLHFYGNVAAGEPIDISIDPEEYLQIPRQAIPGDPEDYFALRIRGYSMTEAGIGNGDIVLIHKAEELISGQIMLVRYQDSSTLKRVIRRNGNVYLRWEDGSGYEKEADSDEYQIQGIFVRVWNGPGA